jgi:hypothetical protein
VHREHDSFKQEAEVDRISYLPSSPATPPPSTFRKQENSTSLNRIYTRLKHLAHVPIPRAPHQKNSMLIDASETQQ